MREHIYMILKEDVLTVKCFLFYSYLFGLKQTYKWTKLINLTKVNPR